MYFTLFYLFNVGCHNAYVFVSYMWPHKLHKIKCFEIEIKIDSCVQKKQSVSKRNWTECRSNIIFTAARR